MDSYLQQQISQSDCEISSNCGKKANFYGNSNEYYGYVSVRTLSLASYVAVAAKLFFAAWAASICLRSVAFVWCLFTLHLFI